MIERFLLMAHSNRACHSDGQLLDLYVHPQDEAAITTFVHRHGPMVWGACRRVLRNDQDVEDAFQATFLVFCRKAAKIESRDLLACWLYGVARRTALKARALAAKRKDRERHAARSQKLEALRQGSSAELQG